MATVPPADRTSPTLDPRYDPLFQRGHADAGSEVRPIVRARVLSGDAVGPAPEVVAEPSARLAEESPVRPPRRILAVLWTVSAALVFVGVTLHFSLGAGRYGSYSLTPSTDGTVRFSDGRSVQQVLATELLTTLAPYLVLLGLATAIGALFLLAARTDVRAR